MRIHIRDVIEYTECPLRYKFRNIDHVRPLSNIKGNGVHTGTDVYHEFDQALHKLAAYIFYMVEAGRYPSLYAMKQKWGALWVQREGHQDAIQELTSWRDERRKKETLGIRVLTDLLEYYRGQHGQPILIDKEYEIHVGHHTLLGSIDLVREIDGVIELVDFKLDDRSTTLHRKNDLEVTAAAYAFRKIAGQKEDRIVYHGFLSGKVEETQRDEKDLQMLELVLDQVEKGINAGIFYPVLNYKCYECPFASYCARKEWL